MRRIAAAIVVLVLIAIVALLLVRRDPEQVGASPGGAGKGKTAPERTSSTTFDAPAGTKTAPKAEVTKGETGATAPRSGALPADAVAIGTSTATPGLVARRPDPVNPDSPANARTGVRGRVVDGRGSAVAGARVSLRGAKAGAGMMRIMRRSSDGSMQVESPGETRSREAATDEQGRFEVTGLDASYRYRIVVESDAFLTAEVPAPALRSEQVVDAGTVTVHEAGSISGIVLGPDRAPVEGARVRLDDGGGFGPMGFLDDDEPAGSKGGAREMRAMFVGGAAKGGPMGLPMPVALPAPVVTGPDGRFTLDKVAPGTHALLAKKKGFRAARRTSIEAAEGERVDGVEITLGKPLELSVVVRDLKAAPIAGARVSAGVGPSRGAPVVTDANGEAVVRGLASSEVSVSIEADGFVPLNTEVKVEGDEKRTFSLRPGASIVGRAVDQDGKPVEGAMVWTEPRVRDGAGLSISSSDATAADGRFHTKSVGPGDWRIRVMKPGLAPASKDVTIASDSLETDAGDLVLNGLSSVDVVVVDPDGHPVEGADVEQDNGGTFVIAVQDEKTDAPGLGRRARTDAAGKARLDRLEPGTISLRATHSGFCDGRATAVVPAASSVTIKLGRGGRVEGQAVAADGTPLGRAHVTLVAKGQRAPSEATTASDGTFAFEHMSPGTYSVWLGEPQEDADWFTVAEGETVRRTVRAQPGVTLAGTVHASDGSPVAGAQVDFGWLDGFHPGDPLVRFPTQSATTDASGRFRLEKLASQAECGVSIGVNGAKSTFRVTLPTAGTLDRDFVLGSQAPAGAVSVQVVDETGAPVLADVTLDRADDGPLVRREVATDDRGAATFATIAAGPWRVSATSPGFARATAAVPVASGATATARLVLSKGGSILVKPVGPSSGDLFVLVSPDPSQPGADPADIHNAVTSAGAPVRIGGLRNGVSYVVAVHAPGGGPSGKATIRCDGDASAPVEIAVTPGS
jgi:protocatechuate 3,4-dioxygenase beta subunit